MEDRQYFSLCSNLKTDLVQISLSVDWLARRMQYLPAKLFFYFHCRPSVFDITTIKLQCFLLFSQFYSQHYFIQINYLLVAVDMGLACNVDSFQYEPLTWEGFGNYKYHDSYSSYVSHKFDLAV